MKLSFSFKRIISLLHWIFIHKMNLVHCNPICAVFDLQCSRVGVWDCQKTATFQNYLHLQEWPKITDHLLHFFFMQLQKGTYEWSWNWQVIRFWSVYPCAYLSCNIVFRSKMPKYILHEVLTQYHSQCYQLYLSDTPN